MADRASACHECHKHMRAPAATRAHCHANPVRAARVRSVAHRVRARLVPRRQLRYGITAPRAASRDARSEDDIHASKAALRRSRHFGMSEFTTHVLTNLSMASLIAPWGRFGCRVWAGDGSAAGAASAAGSAMADGSASAASVAPSPAVSACSGPA